MCGENVCSKILQTCWKEDKSGELPLGPDIPCSKGLEKQWIRIGLFTPGQVFILGTQPNLLGSESWGLGRENAILIKLLQIITPFGPSNQQSGELLSGPRHHLSSPWIRPTEGIPQQPPKRTCLPPGGKVQPNLPFAMCLGLELGEPVFSQDFADPQPCNPIYQTNQFNCPIQNPQDG